jgi:hypothetical protein
VLCFRVWVVDELKRMAGYAALTWAMLLDQRPWWRGGLRTTTLALPNCCFGACDGLPADDDLPCDVDFFLDMLLPPVQ